MFRYHNWVALLLIFNISACFADPCGKGLIADGKKTIEISGILHHESRWGPPNFGEHPKTDSKFTVWIVSLSTPIVINVAVEDRKKTRAKISEIQIDVDPEKLREEQLLRLDDKLVRVSGKVWSATSQGDVTPVVLTVSSLARTRERKTCRMIN